MAGRKHTPHEIAAKVARANEMAAHGKSVREICETLGVSIMTYHRWKKRANSVEAPAGNERHDNAPQMSESTARIKRLEIENLQLRQILADMLLEKHRIEEELRSRAGISLPRLV